MMMTLQTPYEGVTVELQFSLSGGLQHSTFSIQQVKDRNCREIVEFHISTKYRVERDMRE